MAKAGEWRTLQPALSERVLRVLEEELKFSAMTPVQAATLPHFLKNADVAVEAPTGSGKTVAFLIPILEKLTNLEEPLKKKDVGAVILTPTRELARQIMNVLDIFLKSFGEEKKLTSVLLVGGTDINDDLRSIQERGANIIVASPGRLDYVLQKTDKALNIKTLEVLVMDEADRLLDMGFSVNIESILSKLPKQRRTGLFSATQTKQVEELVKAGMRNPIKVTVNVKHKESNEVQTIPATLNNQYLVLEADQKWPFLVQFLSTRRNKKVIVYLLTGAMVDYFWKMMGMLPQLKGITLLSLHGKIPANKRNGLVEKFTMAESAVLLCTDVAARGLDFNDHPIDWIVQFDPPQDPAFFVHRIGRTARMGLEGNAVAFLLPNELTYVDFLRVRGVPIKKTEISQLLGAEDGSKPLPDIIGAVKTLIRKDRDLLDKSVNAFLSYVRAYTEHQCSFIFMLKDLDFGKVLHSFGILRTPGMAELKAITIKGFEDEDTDNIAYKDKKRELQRLEKLANSKAVYAEKEKKKQQKQKKWEQKQAAKKRKLAEMFEDNDSADEEEILRDARLLKKLKRGKITEDEFEMELGGPGVEKHDALGSEDEMDLSNVDGSEDNIDGDAEDDMSMELDEVKPVKGKGKEKETQSSTIGKTNSQAQPQRSNKSGTPAAAKRSQTMANDGGDSDDGESPVDFGVTGGNVLKNKKKQKKQNRQMKAPIVPNGKAR